MAIRTNSPSFVKGWALPKGKGRGSLNDTLNKQEKKGVKFKMSWLKKIWTKKMLPLPNTIYWQAYQQSFKPAYTKKTPLRNIRFVVLDTETTGLDIQKDKILSIGAVAIQNQKIYVADRFEYYLKQVYQGGKEGIKVHGILPKHNFNAVSPPEVLIALLAYLQNSIIVGHHIAFDFAVLNRAFKQHLKGQLQNKTLDTAQLAKRIHSPLYNSSSADNQHVSLDTLCRQYGVPLHNRHTASGDAIITALLFVKLMGKLEKRGITNFGALSR